MVAAAPVLPLDGNRPPAAPLIAVAPTPRLVNPPLQLVLRHPPESRQLTAPLPRTLALMARPTPSADPSPPRSTQEDWEGLEYAAAVPLDMEMMAQRLESVLRPMASRLGKQRAQKVSIHNHHGSYHQSPALVQPSPGVAWPAKVMGIAVMIVYYSLAFTGWVSQQVSDFIRWLTGKWGLPSLPDRPARCPPCRCPDRYNPPPEEGDEEVAPPPNWWAPLQRYLLVRAPEAILGVVDWMVVPALGAVAWNHLPRIGPPLN